MSPLARELACRRGLRLMDMADTRDSVMRRAQVACLADSEAHLALDKDDAFALQTKPHGHGDVHALLHSSGLLKRWVAAGVKWVAFFQDTNGLVFRGLPAAIGARRLLHHPSRHALPG